MTQTRQSDNLALLIGVPAIAEYIGAPIKKTAYLLDSGLIPASKHGHRWVTSRAVLRKHFASVLLSEDA